MKVCFVILPESAKAGRKLDELMMRVRQHIILGNEVTIMKDKPPKRQPVKMWMDEAQHIPMDAFK